jgi:flagellar hook-associated protein 2
MPFHIGGLVSGIDTEGMISQLISAASQPKQLMVRQQGAIEDKKEAFGTLRARMTSLKTAMEALDTPLEFRSVAGASSDDAAVGVTTSGEAVVGSFDVQVTHLATAAMCVGSTTFSSRTTGDDVATGTLNLTYGSTTTALTIAAGTSLDDLVTQINDEVAGVSAYVMDTGDASEPYRLVISGQDTGAANGITVDISGLDGGTGKLPSVTTATSASDAALTVNGVAITHADNDIDGVIEGVTFNAYETTTSAVRVSVSRDVDGMVDKVNSLVTSYNAVMSYIRQQQVYNQEENMKGAFVGETDPRSAKSDLQSALGGNFSAASSVYSSLGAIGLETAQNGDISFDEDALREALNSDFGEVVKLVTNSTSGVAAVVNARIDEWVDTTDGTLTERIDSLDDQIDRFQERIDRFETRMESYETRMRRQFTAMEVAMSRFQTAENALAALMPQNSSGNDS